MNNQIIKSIDEVKLGQEIGFTYSANHEIYKGFGTVQKISGQTVKINTGEKYPFTYSFRKLTKSNHVFILESKEEVNNFNQKRKEIREKVDKIINKYWENRIAKAEQEKKEQGVYNDGEVWVMDETGFHKSHTKYGISV